MSNRLEPIIGVEIIDDIRLGHTFYEVDVLSQFILKSRPRHFIEIGVHEGGLSYMLIPKFFTARIEYTGVEIDCELVRQNVKNMYAKYNDMAVLLCQDCFNHNLFEVIQRSKNKVIYCDGGNKAKEIAHFQNACQSGDIIMCHDFYDGTRVVRGVPEANISIEVTSKDVQIYENSTAWKRLPESVFKETRIIGWIKL